MLAAATTALTTTKTPTAAMTTLTTNGTTMPTTSMLMTTTTTTAMSDKARRVTKQTTHNAQTLTTTAARATTGTGSRSATTVTATATTTITSDPGILCFHHCNVKVFCFHLPHRCPKCKQVLDTGVDVDNKNDAAAVAGDDDEEDVVRGNELVSNGCNGERTRAANGVPVGVVGSTRLLPFRLPYPFIRASQYPCAIVLRPTTGDFLNDYNNSTDLHIAVTTSTGCVVEFDRYGLRRHRPDNTRMSDWWQCLLVGDVPEPWYDYWDDILQQICNQPDRWTVSHYQEDSHNCYTFVLAFLQALAYDKLSAAARSKTSFCEKYIVPRTTTAGKYISLYRKLRDTGIYVHPHPHHQHQRHLLLNGKQQQQQHQHHQHSYNQQHLQVKPSRGKSRNNGHLNGHVGATSALLANGGKATSIILRAPNLCTIEE